MTATTDWSQQLAQVGKDQDKTAFSELFQHFSPLLKSFLMNGSNLNTEIAEELVQETMVKVWTKSPGYSPAHASASTWIYTIARNTRIDWFRKQSRQNPKMLNAEDIYGTSEEESPDSTLVKIRRSNLLREQLSDLPPEQSQILNMMYWHGLSGQQVASALTLPLGTVKSRIRLALAKLKLNSALQSSQND